jgi:hypothetical protein
VLEYDVISTVRVTGINRTTDEFRIPAEVLSSQHGATCDANAVQAWLDAGYRPSLIQKAWEQLSDDVVANFGDKVANVAIKPTDSGAPANVSSGNGQFPFPPIDEMGCVYLKGIPIWARSNFTGECTLAAKVTIPERDRPLPSLTVSRAPVSGYRFAGVPCDPDLRLSERDRSRPLGRTECSSGDDDLSGSHLADTLVHEPACGGPGDG